MSGYDRGITILNWPLGVLCFIGILLMATMVLSILGICLIIFNPSNRSIWLSMILAPIGGLSRHFLGMYLNGWKRYPAGTFLANQFGSLILTVLTVTRLSISSSNETEDIEWDPILEITTAPDDNISNFIILSVGSGFCSSISTISSFVNDIVNLPPKRRYFYAIGTIFITQSISCVIYLIFFSISDENGDA